ncbi:hypothetical protein [Streptomyces canarius]
MRPRAATPAHCSHTPTATHPNSWERSPTSSAPTATSPRHQTSPNDAQQPAAPAASRPPPAHCAPRSTPSPTSCCSNASKPSSFGLHPNQLKTIEIRLDTIRDLALHLHPEGHKSWASVTTADLESFSPWPRPAAPPTSQECVGCFAHAHHSKTILHNPRTR